MSSARPPLHDGFPDRGKEQLAATRELASAVREQTGVLAAILAELGRLTAAVLAPAPAAPPAGTGAPPVTPTYTYNALAGAPLAEGHRATVSKALAEAAAVPAGRLAPTAPPGGMPG